MHLHQLIEHAKENTNLLIFPLLNIEKKYDIEIITHRDAPKLKIINEFSRALENTCRECYQDIEEYLASK